MEQQPDHAPIERLDPERLKHERNEVDFGTDVETEHNLVGRERGRGPSDAAGDPIAAPTAGSTPPAR